MIQNQGLFNQKSAQQFLVLCVCAFAFSLSNVKFAVK